MSKCASCGLVAETLPCAKCRRRVCYDCRVWGDDHAGPFCSRCAAAADPSMPLFAARKNTGPRSTGLSTPAGPAGTVSAGAHPSPLGGQKAADSGPARGQDRRPGPGPEVEGDPPRFETDQRDRRGPGFSYTEPTRPNLARAVAAMVDGDLGEQRAAIARHVKRDVLERERDVEALTPAELEAFGRAALRFKRPEKARAPKDTRRRHGADQPGGAP